MNSKPKKNVRKSFDIPLITCECVEITDPAEIAAFQRRIREAEKYMVNGYWDGKKPKNRKKKRRPS